MNLRTRSHSARRARIVALVATGCALLALAGETAARADCGEPYTQFFRAAECTFAATGRTPYFILEPGHWVRLRGYDDGNWERVTITVLDQTEVVNGVTTRVVEEREFENGELKEVSRNFFAICQPTNNVFYFGEDVDNYEDGEIVDHEGAWRAGVDGARPGVIMPGSFMLGSRYFQEFAPDVALDRACNTRMGLVEETPVGTLRGCVEVIETSPLDEPGHSSLKRYCPGIGMVRDNEMKLVAWSGQP